MVILPLSPIVETSDGSVSALFSVIFTFPLLSTDTFQVVSIFSIAPVSSGNSFNVHWEPRGRLSNVAIPYLSVVSVNVLDPFSKVNEIPGAS